MLFAGWAVHIVKNCDRGLENAAFSLYPRSQFFTVRTDPEPVNNLFSFFRSLKREKKTHASVTVTVGMQRKENPNRAKNQSDCRIRYRARLENW